MFTNDANGPDCWKCSLNVEWHDCSFCPVIQLRQGIVHRNGTGIKPLPTAALLPHPARRKNLFKPMKKTLLAPRRFRAGFTLVELLTVIAIIGILAAMLLPVLTAARKAAQKTKAKTEIQDLVTQIQGYDQAYGRFPISKQLQDHLQSINWPGDFTYGGNVFATNASMNPAYSTFFTNNSEVIAILMDITNYPVSSLPTANNGHVKNPQQTKFLNAKMVSDTTSAGVGTDLIYRDPWGNPYVISMDLNYDDQCQDAFYDLNKVSGNNQASGNPGLNGLNNPDTTKPDNFRFHGKVMVWSAGPDGKVDPAIPANIGVNKDNILSW